MVRFLVLLLVAVVVLASPPTVPNAMAQLMRWCPAGDGGILAGVGVGNRSVDFNFDGAVNLIDLAYLAQRYPSPPRPFDLCVDFDNSGLVTLPDLAFYAFHHGHAGPVIGLCN